MKKELIELLNNLEEEDLDNILTDLYEFYFNFVAVTYKDFVDAEHIEISTSNSV